MPESLQANPAVEIQFQTLFEWIMDPALEFSRKKCKRTMTPVNDVTVVAACLRLLSTFTEELATPREGDVTEGIGLP